MKIFAPAKVNLMLSVHGRRGDGFHELTSVVAALDFGDQLEMRLNDSGRDSLLSEGMELPLDETNLVLQAARRFREASGTSRHFDFRLEKRIPVGAGLGGGSSDAVAALKGMDALLGTGMGVGELQTVAAALGSDCPFFVEAVPAVMRGRGERIEPLGPALAERLCGQPLVLWRPSFGVQTAWAYRQLASMPELYEDEARTEARLRTFSEGGGWDDFMYNVFEAAVGWKFLAIPSLLEELRGQGHNCMMSGSGSACFALVEDDDQIFDLKEACSACWGGGMFWVETSLAGRKMHSGES